MIIKSCTDSLSVKRNCQRIITETQRRKYQHELSNWIKKHGKSVLEKGPENVDVKITGNMLILTITSYLTKYEKFILKTDDSSAIAIKDSRLKADLAIIKSGELNRHIEEYLDVKVLGHVFDAMVQDDWSVWIILLDTCLTT